jgi:hypothetical protein
MDTPPKLGRAILPLLRSSKDGRSSSLAEKRPLPLSGLVWREPVREPFREVDMPAPCCLVVKAEAARSEDFSFAISSAERTRYSEPDALG